jgi:hypothetical protein
LGSKRRIYLAYLNSASSNDTSTPPIETFQKLLRKEDGHFVADWSKPIDFQTLSKTRKDFGIIVFIGHGLYGKLMYGTKNPMRLTATTLRQTHVRKWLYKKYVVFGGCFTGLNETDPDSLLRTTIEQANARIAIGINGESVFQIDELLVNLLLKSHGEIPLSGPRVSGDMQTINDILGWYNKERAGPGLTVLVNVRQRSHLARTSQACGHN